MCGIGDYTSFLTCRSPVGQWGVLSFNLEKYGAPLITDRETAPSCIWYGIPDRHSFSASVIQDGLHQLSAKKNSLLWFQHEFGIWPNRMQFVSMLKNLEIPKVVSPHTIHFQSSETPSGLRGEQYDFLRILLPYLDAITVFSRGVYQAVTSAFPEYREKVYVIRHGIHSYPEVSRLSRREAKEKLNDFLLFDSNLDLQTKEALHQQRIFLSPGTFVLGQTGFLSPAKGSELLYTARDILQEVISNKRIVAVRIGSARDELQRTYAAKLRSQQEDRPNFLIETWLPPSMLPVAQRAFDVNFYWPIECTQSGLLAHALGAGAIVAGRDLEGVGETLREARQLTDSNLIYLLTKIQQVIINPELAEIAEERALNYAAEFSWENQIRRHYELAEHILHRMPMRSVPPSPFTYVTTAVPGNEGNTTEYVQVGV